MVLVWAHHYVSRGKLTTWDVASSSLLPPALYAPWPLLALKLTHLLLFHDQGHLCSQDDLWDLSLFNIQLSPFIQLHLQPPFLCA